MPIAMALLMLLLFTAPAHAVSVTSGHLLINSSFDPDYHLVGPTFSLDCLSQSSCGSPTATFMSERFPPGTPVNVNATVAVNAGTVATGPLNRLVLDGTTYRGRGAMTFAAQPVLQTTGNTLSTPFTMSGMLDLLHPETLIDLGDFHFTGQGRANVTMMGDIVGQVRFVRYEFDLNGGGNGGGPGVIPEPSTVLLVASGLAGLGLWRRRSAHT
jgi:hypothetical protein